MPELDTKARGACARALQYLSDLTNYSTVELMSGNLITRNTFSRIFENYPKKNDSEDIASSEFVARGMNSGGVGDIKDLLLSLLTFGIYCFIKTDLLEKKKAAIEQALIDVHSKLNKFPDENVSVEVDGNILRIEQRDLENGSSSLCVLFNNNHIKTIEGLTLSQFKRHLEMDIARIGYDGWTAEPEEVVRARRAMAISLGGHCSTIVNDVILKSNTRNYATHGRTPQTTTYGKVVNSLRSNRNHASRVETAVLSVADSFKYSCGNCLEMAFTAAALVQLSAEKFLSARGLNDVEIHVEIYITKTNGDHGFCVANFAVEGQVYRIAIDPWAQVSMSYDDYVRYVTTYPSPPYTRVDSTFGVCREWTEAVTSDDFKNSTGEIFAKYGIELSR
ncbi:hypothetical protein [Paraburkholderia sp. RL17-373-BIF-A]|uniref:hypothetical protein n=1 Tax=Paraburkholderia sp. RL17-373-BIF-A TaxID=3031629 RepID=UPI0038BC6ECB